MHSLPPFICSPHHAPSYINHCLRSEVLTPPPVTQIQPLIVDLSNQPYHFSVSSLFSPTELTFSSGTFLTAYIILLNIHVLTHTHTHTHSLSLSLILPSLSPHFSVLCYREMQKKKKKKKKKHPENSSHIFFLNP